jgi:AcrR family transcriptional regulator
LTHDSKREVASGAVTDHDEGEVHRRPGRPREQGYDQAILDAALEILNAKGYASLSIDGVAARAGVGRPTIYRRWPSKAALVIAALTQSPGASSVPDTGGVRDDLLAFVRDQVRLMDAPGSRRITAGLVADLVADPELAERYLAEYVGMRRSAVYQALQRGIDRGELRRDADLPFVYDMLIGPLLMRSVVSGERLGRGIAEQTVDAVLAAFGPQQNGHSQKTAAPRKRRPAARRTP